MAVVLSLPYWYVVWQANKSPWYQDSVLRNGLFYTHYPLFNKVLLAVVLLYSFIIIIEYIKYKKILSHQWFVFCFALILGGLWALNQQVVTGTAIWPFHFVQYTIPFAIIAVMAALYRYKYVRGRYNYLWGFVIVLVISSSLWFGVYTQAHTYRRFLSYNLELQNYGAVFDWLNTQPKDCVVLVRENLEQPHTLNGMIPAFTHCNFYAYNWTFSLMPEERIYHSYLVNIRLQGVFGDEAEAYVAHHQGEARTYLFSNWKGLYGVPLFPDFSDEKLPMRLQQLPDDYRAFLQKDFKTELQKYRLDYILSEDEPLSENLINELAVTLVFNTDTLFVYRFSE